MCRSLTERHVGFQSDAMADIDLDAILARHKLTAADVRGLGFSVRAVDYWRTGGRKVSIQSALLIEQKLAIPRHELRPDIWPPPPTRSRRGCSMAA
jgi:DNA-binding transcriptional regulator YdaS (Cro superfamily)